MAETFYVYIMTNQRNTTLYTGITNNLERRVFEHKNNLGGAFSAKYKLSKLVYFEETNDPIAGIEREKQIKTGSRKKKIELIESMNQDWQDLSKSYGI